MSTEQAAYVLTARAGTWFTRNVVARVPARVHPVRIACVRLTPETARAVLGAHMYGWLEEYSLPTRVDYWVTVAEQAGRVIGAHAFEVSGTTLYSRSTYALTRVRGLGLGERLWSHSLSFVEPSAAVVTCASVAGKRLIERVMAAHPSIAFRVIHACL